MNVESFLAYYDLIENPFAAEEARQDPVFSRMIHSSMGHPDFPKILGQIDKPSTAVVFGEKGSGKTALRLLIGEHVAAHNRTVPERRMLLVAYDNFNPFLDNLLRAKHQDARAMLADFRLEDHQDAILALAVSRLVRALLGELDDGDAPVLLPNRLGKTIASMPRQARVDLAVLAGLYDQPDSGSVAARWRKLRSKLRLGRQRPLIALRDLAFVLTAGAIGLALTNTFMSATSEPRWLVPVWALVITGAVLSWGYWLWRHIRLWWLCRQTAEEMRAINRPLAELRNIFADLRPRDLDRQPIPLPVKTGQAQRDTRYQLTRRLMSALGHLGYVGMTVLVDRVDEPTVVSGDAERMKAIIWPMFDNQFLQQERIGFKLLLPIELRYLLHRESPQFFQEARLDKQNMIDRLSWSGAMLYDLCSSRLRACHKNEAGDLALTDLFEQDVTQAMLVDALDQMHQPRDAFKFLYGVIQEHCRLVPEDEANYRIARLTLESVRRGQAQRVHELYRGLIPS